MNARTLELLLALQAIETRLLALLDTRTAALWACIPSPPANEIDAAQERGEVARPNQPVSQYVRAVDIPATFEAVGLSRQRVSEWRDLRDAGEVATDGRPKTVQAADSFPATFVALGFSRQRGAEWRELGDAGEPGSDFDTIVSKLPAAEAHHHG